MLLRGGFYAGDYIGRKLKIKTVAVYQKPSSTFTPDFVAEKMKEQLWIIQPFEVEE